jgi:Protein of unknown function (DUF4038)/Domain of unknown function (DUF5060)/Putative collagen-binding domain of a collagenase
MLASRAVKGNPALAMQRLVFALSLLANHLAWADPREVAFSQPAASVAAYDFVEVSLQVSSPVAGNPFTDAAVTGWFGMAGAIERVKVDGFCDSSDGTLFRIRFMPSKPGDYAYSVKYAEKGFEKNYDGTFHATNGGRRGPIRVDPEYRWHFIWEGTREHYFFHGTTAFWLMGWRDERVIGNSLERLRRLKINRVRVLLSGRTNTMYGEPAMNTADWSLFLSPWPAVKADDFYHPGFDYTRFRVEHWQRFERMLRYARERDMVISVILDIADGRIHLTPGSEDEGRYIRYATARLTAFSNITWDLGDDLDSFRDDKWAHDTGTLLESWDPYRHLATTHPVHREHQDRGSEWFGFTSIQDWSRNQHALMLEERQLQMKTGRIIPQANEEYGYEDHYPLWAPPPPGDSAETLRRTAWDIAMAGAYGTAGETARRGVGIWPDTGGGWMNGRSDDTTTMLTGYAHMVDFLTSFEWWKTEPHDELVDGGNWCLAEPGRTYAVYLPKAGKVTVRLVAGLYNAEWFNPMTGEVIPIGVVEGPAWTSPAAPGRNDWAILLRK